MNGNGITLQEITLFLVLNMYGYQFFTKRRRFQQLYFLPWYLGNLLKQPVLQIALTIKCLELGSQRPSAIF